MITIALFFILIPSVCLTHNFPQKMLIKDPTTGLFPAPDTTKRMCTQLLYGERMIALEEKSGWLKIQALEESIFGLSSARLEGFEGWIKTDTVQPCDNFIKPNIVIQSKWSNIYQQASLEAPVIFKLSFGTLLHASRIDDIWLKVVLVNGEEGFVLASDTYDISVIKDIHSIRKRLVNLAQKFLGVEYRIWGRSAAQVNCSGFINLLYRACGLLIPLKAHDQYLMSNAINAAQLQPGDLVFISHPDKRPRMAHVLMYLGDELFIEASFDLGIVRTVTGQKVFGSSTWKELENGAECTKSIVYFGSLLSDEESVQNMHHDLSNLFYLDRSNNWRCSLPLVTQV